MDRKHKTHINKIWFEVELEHGFSHFIVPSSMLQTYQHYRAFQKMF